jgi:hypothetical protein
MKRDGAVGWRDIPLDGLTCYHRCVEAILRDNGFTADDVADELGGTITDRLGTDGRPLLRLRRSSARWLIAPAGQDHWNDVKAGLNAGRSIVVWPDGYFWPGDVCEGRRHVHHHAVLAVGIDGDSLHVLDIDADEAEGFLRVLPLTSETRRACTRILELTEVRRARPVRAADMRRMVAGSIRPLARFADAAALLAARWEAGADRRLARAADLWVLGDVQPQLFLFAVLCQRFGLDAVAARSFEAADMAKKISLFLYGIDRYKPRPPYDLCRNDIAALAGLLSAAGQATADLTGNPSPVAAGAAEPWLWRRLETLSVWHFGAGLNGRSPAGA